MRHTQKILITMTTIAALLVAGCQSESGSGALLGSLAGAGIGAIIGHQSGNAAEGALIGGALGGGAGYMIGNEKEKQHTRSEIATVRAEMNTVTVNVTNSNGSIIPVRLEKYGMGYVGPRGEYYPTVPTPEQLRPVYGF